MNEEESAVDRTRCSSQALVPGGLVWKSCIREKGHSQDEPHVWLEDFAVVGRRPMLLTWYGPRASVPTVSTVHVAA